MLGGISRVWRQYEIYLWLVLHIMYTHSDMVTWKHYRHLADHNRTLFVIQIQSEFCIGGCP